MKIFASVMSFFLVTSVFAQTSQDFEIGEITVVETTARKGMKRLFTEDPEPRKEPTFEEKAERVGKVIGLAKDMIALGETFYELVKKGKPSNTTEYAAISVVPKDPNTKEYVSPFDLEGFSLPMERSFRASVKSVSGKEVVRFDYQIVYAYGGSFDGKGKYLMGVMIVPKHIETSWGWEFNATMKLDAIMNHGSKENPVAGALITMKYKVTGWSKSVERNDSIHVTGAGQVKSLGVK